MSSGKYIAENCHIQSYLTSKQDLCRGGGGVPEGENGKGITFEMKTNKMINKLK